MKLNPSFIFIKVDTFKTSDVLEIKKFGLRQKVTLDGWKGRERERGGGGGGERVWNKNSPFVKIE